MSAFCLSQRNHSSGVIKYSKANENYNENTLHKYPTTKKIEINLKGKKDLVSAFSEDIMLMRKYYEKKTQKIKEKIMNGNQIVYTEGNVDNNSKVKVTFHTPGKNETKYIRVNRNFSKTGKMTNSNSLSRSNEIKSESKINKYFSSKFNKKESEKRTASKNKVLNSIKQTTISQSKVNEDEYEFKKYASLTALPKNEFNGIKVFIYKKGKCINNVDLELKKNEDLNENKIKEFNAILQKMPLQRSNKILKIVSTVKSNSQQKLKESKKFKTIEIQKNCNLFIKNVERSNRKKGTLKIEKKEINLIQKNHQEEKKKETMQKHKTETKTIKNKIKQKEENKKSNTPKKIEKKDEDNKKNIVKKDAKKKSNEKPKSILKQKEVKNDESNIEIEVKQFVNSIFEENIQNIIKTNNEKPKETTTLVQEKIEDKTIESKPKEEEKSNVINETQDIEKKVESITESNPIVEKDNDLKVINETKEKKEILPLEEKKNEEKKNEEVVKEESKVEEIKEVIIENKENIIAEEQNKEEIQPPKVVDENIVKEEEIKEETIPNTNKESIIKKEPESPIKISYLDKNTNLNSLTPTKLNIHPIYIEDKSKELLSSDDNKDITKPHPKPKPIEPPSPIEPKKEENQPFPETSKTNEVNAEKIIKEVSTELKLDLPEITRKYIEFNKPVMKNKHKPDFKAFVEEYSKAKEIELKNEETLKEAVAKARNLRGMLRKKKQNN